DLVSKGRLPAAWRNLNRETRRRAAASTRIRSLARARAPLPPPESAKIAGLRYVDNARTAGIRRVGPKRGRTPFSRARGRKRRTAPFQYVAPDGRTLSDRAELQRIIS